MHTTSYFSMDTWMSGTCGYLELVRSEILRRVITLLAYSSYTSTTFPSTRLNKVRVIHISTSRYY